MAEHRAYLYDRARRALDRMGAPGAAVALLTGEGQLLHAHAGHADPRGESPLRAGARFPVYSVTKPLIAAALLTLAAEDQLTLDAPVETYLPHPVLPGPVTVRQLLSHTGGLPDYGNLPAYQGDLRAQPTRPWSTPEFLARTLEGGLRFAPGTGFAYSNIGYLILRLLIERLTGQTLRRALHARLFAPLGLTNTGVAENLEDTAALTPGFSSFWSDGELQDVRPLYHPGWVAHGLVTSSAVDLARLSHAVFTGRFFGTSLLREMLTPVVVGGQHPVFHLPAYGLGVMIDGAAPGGVAGHGGGGPGYSAGAVHLRGLAGPPVTAVALVNRDLDDAGLRLAHELAVSWADRAARP